MLEVGTGSDSSSPRCDLGPWSVSSSGDGRHLQIKYRDAVWLDRLRVELSDGATEVEHAPALSLRETGDTLLAGADGAEPFELLFSEEGRSLLVHLRAAGDVEHATLHADVDGGRHPINARLQEGEDDVDLIGSRAKPYTGAPFAEVQQMASGLGASGLSDSVYDRYRDEAVTVRGRDVRFGPREGGFRVSARGPCDRRPLCRIEVSERVLSAHVPHFTPLDKEAWPAPPILWDSFYALGIYEFDADDVLANAEILERELGDYGFRYCLIDGGWQKAKIDGEWVPHNYGHWWTANDRFPGGMARLAERLRALGVAPALWFSVFATVDEELYEQHREWFMHDAQGGGVLGKWIGDHVVDLSHPEVRSYLQEHYREVRESWGYEYLKLDGLAQARELWRVNRERAYDPSLSADDAFRGALSAVRDAVGPETFIAGCRKDLVGVGILHSTRLGTDTVDPGDDETLSFRGVRSVLEGMRLAYHVHNVAIYADPDAIALRPPLGLEEAQTWVSVMALSGQMVTLGDDMTSLPAERVELLRKLLPIADVTPMDLFPVDRDRYIWLLHVQRSFGGWAVLGLFNWDYAADELVDVGDEQADIFKALDHNDELLGEEHDWGVRWSMATHAQEAVEENKRLAGLAEKPPALRYLPVSSYASPPAPRRIVADFASVGLDPARPYALFDFWAQRYLGVVTGEHAVELAPHACQVLSARPATPHPQLIGTDRHVTMGAVEIDDESWDDDRRELAIAVRVAPERPMTLTVRTLGLELHEATAEGASVTSASGEDAARVTVVGKRAEPTVVRLKFE